MKKRNVSLKNKRRLDAYVIVGDPNMGKSSVARHLYGATKGPYNRTAGNILIKPIKLLNGNIIRVGIEGYQSLQEAGVSPQQFANYLQKLKQRPDAILFTLQLNPRPKLNAGAQAYFIALRRILHIAATAVLDVNPHAVHNFPNSRTFQSFPKGVPMAGSAVITTNELARSVRQFFQWV